MSTPLELPYVSCLPCRLKACALSCSPLPYLCCSWWQPGDYFSWQFSHCQECPRCICCGCAESGKVSQSQSQAAGGMRLGGGCAWQAGQWAGRLTGLIPSFLVWIFRQPGDSYTVGCLIFVGICFWEVLATEAGESVYPNVCLSFWLMLPL